jgi:hypothetical protein
VNGRFGEVICILVILIAGYEALAIRLPSLPTISRILQGWRDSPGSSLPVWIVVFLILSIVNLFAAWLFHHLLFEPRSGL